MLKKWKNDSILYFQKDAFNDTQFPFLMINLYDNVIKLNIIFWLVFY